MVFALRASVLGLAFGFVAALAGADDKDEEGVAAKKFGVPVTAGGTVKTKGADGKLMELKRNSTLARWTFIVGKDGKIAYINAKVDPIQDAKKIADFIDKAEAK